jgi:hypothetical protein
MRMTSSRLLCFAVFSLAALASACGADSGAEDDVETGRPDAGRGSADGGGGAGPDDAGGTGSADSGSTDAGGALSDAFWGERQCDFTTATFAGEWSPADTTTQTMVVEEVEGGFSMGGRGQENPFASCPIYFDYDGATAALRQPQPCTDGVASYDTGTVVVDGDDFSFDVLGQAFGYTVSMKVDCGAGEVSIDPDGDPGPAPDPTVWPGAWQCTGDMIAPLGAPPFPLEFVHTIAAEGEGRLRSTFAPARDVDMFIAILGSCNVLWDEESETVAQIAPDAQCATSENSWVRSETGMTLSNGTLAGTVDIEQDGTISQRFTFTCSR